MLHPVSTPRPASAGPSSGLPVAALPVKAVLAEVAEGVVLSPAAMSTAAPEAGAPHLQALSTAMQAAAAVVGGPSGHTLGVTIGDLLGSKAAIEKGYHLPKNFIDGYYERRILPYQSHPTYTESDGAFYRGMYITVEELAHIMDQGFETWRNTWSAVGGQGVYVSTSQREADDYIFQAVDPSKKNAIGVVFKMERGDYAHLVDDPQCNATNTIYKSDGDVGPERIVDVYVRGQYGLERLADIVEKARKGEVQPNTEWVKAFDGWFNR